MLTSSGPRPASTYGRDPRQTTDEGLLPIELATNQVHEHEDIEVSLALALTLA